MTKVIELEGRIVTIRFKQIEINGETLIAPGRIEVSPLSLSQHEELPEAEAALINLAKPVD